MCFIVPRAPVHECVIALKLWAGEEVESYIPGGIEGAKGEDRTSPDLVVKNNRLGVRDSWG